MDGIRRVDRPRRRGVWAIGAVLAAAALGGGIWLLAPIQSGAQGETCALVPGQPEHPLELNSVGAGELAKTVVQEKEVYECRNAGTLVSVTDLETFIEIVERDTGTDVTTVGRRIDMARCQKLFNAPGVANGAVNCDSRRITPVPLDDHPLVGCTTDGIPQPLDPVAMDTVAFGTNNRTVKTIKVDKEVATCPGGSILDIYLFTEIIEARTAAPNYQVVRRLFDGFACRKQPQVADIVGCVRIDIG